MLYICIYKILYFMTIYHFDTVLQEGRYKGKTVQEVFDKNKDTIFKLIKKYGYSFDDEVLAAAHITKTVSNHRTYLEWEHHSAENVKKLRKDTKSIEEILDEFEDNRIKIKEPKNIENDGTYNEEYKEDYKENVES